MSKLIFKTDNEISTVINEYLSGSTLNELGNKYSCDPSSIMNLLKRNNVPRRIGHGNGKCRTIFFNEQFFDIIDTEAKAYWLGFMFADGCVNSNKINVRFELSVKDEDAVKLFAKHINYPIDKLKYKFQNGTWNIMMNLNSKHMAESLIKHKCTTRKSLTLEFPTTVPDELLHHFCRGFLDGDGGIGWYYSNRKLDRYKYAYRRIKISSTMSFLLDYLDIVKRLSGATHTNIYRNKKIHDLIYTRSKDIDKFFNWAYKDATVYLERKYNKFIINE